MSKVIIITGGTSGIGRAAALGLALGDVNLVLVGRNARRGAEVEKRLRQRSPHVRARFIPADLSSQKDVRRLSRIIQHQFGHLDVLINNAGGRFDVYEATEDGIERTFATNHLGHFLLTCLLFEALNSARSAQVITVSSQAHRGAEADGSWLYQEQGYDRRQAYAKSKLANILFAFELARRLEGTRIVSNAVDPGAAVTNFALNNGLVAWTRHAVSHWVNGTLVSPTIAADTIVYLAASPEPVAVTGSLFRQRQIVDPSEQAQNPSLATELWTQSVRLTGADIEPRASERST